ncbi:MAG: aspartate/glutamate racemase family protein [Desulfobacteraceae bacterium]|jgi:aspartate racemase
MKHTVVPMKTIGLLGGMSTEATREYYRLINEGVNRFLGGHNVAELLLCSVNFQNIERFVRNGQWEEAGAYLAQKAKQVEAGGADYLFLATNTMHRVRDAILSAVSIPFVDIFEVAARAVQQKGLRTVALLGTYPVMTDPFYREAYHSQGVETISPPEAEMREVDRIIFDEMCHHRFLPSSKQYYIDVVNALRDQGAEGVILGCTEIKMLISPQDFPGFPVFDTTELHCDEAVRLCVGREAS